MRSSVAVATPRYSKAHPSCKTHSKQSLSYDEVQSKLGEDLIYKLTKNLSLASYGVSLLAEVYEKELELHNRTTLKDIVESSANQMFEFCNFCCNELSSVFSLGLSKLFMSKFIPSYDKLWHNCKDYKGKKGYSEQSVTCSCTMYEVLLRNISLWDTSLQFVPLFKNLSKDDEFRKYMAVSYMKYLHFIFFNDDPKRRSVMTSHSKFTKTSADLYNASSDLCEIAIRSGYTINIFEILEDVLLKCTTFQGSFQSLVYELKVLLDYMMRPHTNSCKLLLKNNYILIIMIELLSAFEDQHNYPRPILPTMPKNDLNCSFISDSLQCEGLVNSIVRRAILQIDELDENERQAGLSKLSLYWKEAYNRNLRKDKKKDQGAQVPTNFCFHPVLERLLQHVIRGSMLETSKDSILEFISKRLEVKADILARSITERMLMQMGGINLVASLDSSEQNQVSQTYHSPVYNLFDNVILIVQTLLPLIPQEEVYELIVKSYFSFSKEISDFLLTSKPLPSENMASSLSLIEEFFKVFAVYNDR